MDGLKTEIEGLSLVLVGGFNPSIYHPAWFAQMGLIRQEEVDVAVEVVHPQVSSHTIGSIKIQVSGDRFTASTINAAEYEIMRDLVASTFKILPHTPIRMMGINWDAHYRMSSLEALHKLLNHFSPPATWTSILEKPELITVTMEGKRGDSTKGYIRVKLEASNRVKNGVGLYVNINDHYEVAGHKPEDGCAEIMKLMAEQWETSTKNSRSIANAIARS